MSLWVWAVKDQPRESDDQPTWEDVILRKKVSSWVYHVELSHRKPEQLTWHSPLLCLASTRAPCGHRDWRDLLPPTGKTSRRSLSRCGRVTVGASNTERRRSIWRWVNSSVAVTPESWAIMWASRAMELALWIRSSTSDMSFWILFFEAESRRKRRTFC